MSTSEESSVYPDGVTDVSIVVPSCFENPLREESVGFLADVLLLRRRAALPVAAVLGAYHIVTRYLGVPRVAAKAALAGLLRTASPALYPHVTPEVASDALDYASAYGVESWDGYLLSLARSFGTSVVYSLDEELKKVKEVTVVNPFSAAKTKEYHKALVAGAKRRR